MRLVFIVSAMFISIFMNSCTSEGFVEDYGDMTELRDSLSQAFPGENIQVEMSNGMSIGVLFINSELKQLEQEEKQKIALKVGLITRHFFDEKKNSEWESYLRGLQKLLGI